MAGLSLNAESQRLIQVAKNFGFSDYDQSFPIYKSQDLLNAIAYGRNIELRINAVGGGINNLQELIRAETPATVPESATIGFTGVTENSFLVFWDPNGDGGSQITGFHLVIKNEDTGQTITELNTSFNTTNTLIQNLNSGTNYKAYVIVINEIGNSFEQSYGVKTLGVKDLIIPNGFHQMPDGSIMADSAMLDFIIEDDGLVRMFRIGSVEYTEIKIQPDSVQSIIDRNVGRLLTAQERAIPYPRIVVPPVVVPPVVVPIIISAEVQVILNKFNSNDYSYPSWFNSNITFVTSGQITSQEFLNSFNGLLETGVIVDTTIVIIKEYDVNTYRLNEFGGVYNEMIYGIDGNRLLQLEAEFLVTIVGSPTPSDQEVKDFYNYIDVDTSINPTMVEQRFLSFKIVDGYVEGKINFIATQFFTDYWKNKIIYAHLQIKDSNGNAILVGDEPKQATKVNELKFVLDNNEQISYREYIGNIQAVTLEIYVWDITQKQLLNGRNPNAFSTVKTLEVVVSIDPDKSCPTGYHLGFNGKCVPDGGTDTGGATSIIGKALGVTALFGALALLGAKRR